METVKQNNTRKKCAINLSCQGADFHTSECGTLSIECILPGKKNIDIAADSYCSSDSSSIYNADEALAITSKKYRELKKNNLELCNFEKVSLRRKSKNRAERKIQENSEILDMLNMEKANVEADLEEQRKKVLKYSNVNEFEE
jgi:superfamily I DNA and RNA helicase